MAHGSKSLKCPIFPYSCVFNLGQTRLKWTVRPPSKGKEKPNAQTKQLAIKRFLLTDLLNMCRCCSCARDLVISVNNARHGPCFTSILELEVSKQTLGTSYHPNCEGSGQREDKAGGRGHGRIKWRAGRPLWEVGTWLEGRAWTSALWRKSVQVQDHRGHCSRKWVEGRVPDAGIKE